MRLHALFSCSLAALIACHHGTSQPPAGPPALPSGEASLQASADGTSLVLKRGSETLLTFPADAFQLGVVDDLDDTLSYDPYTLATSPDSAGNVVWKAASSYKIVKQTAGELDLELDSENARAFLTVKADAPGRFSAVLTPDTQNGLPTAYLRLRPRASATEAFYGLGELPDAVNSRGLLRPMQIEADLGAEGGDNEFHAPVPLLIGTRGWGVFVESRRPGLFNVATQDPTLIEITYGTGADSANGLQFHLFTAAQPLDVIKHFYDLTGYPKLPATWALGPWIWRDEVKDQAQAEDDIAQINALDVPTSGYWLDRPYATGVETFDYDPNKFTNPDQLIQDLHDNGLRVALWHTPYVAQSGTEASPQLNEEATSMGYFPPTTGLPFNHWGKPIDFTNSAAYSWWQTLLHRYTDHGIEGFKLDYGEDVQVGIAGARDVWKFSDGSDERTMHYGYTLLYHQVYSELLPQTGGFLLCRTARWGDQVHGGIIWPGDLDASFAKAGDVAGGKTLVGGLPAAVVKGLSLSASGFPFYASDTGGYRASPPDKETYLRWIEASSLFVAMETGDASSETPWEFPAGGTPDPEALSVYRTYARLHMRLFPYKWTYVQNMLKDGRPITRPFGLQYPALGAHPSDEFFLGDSLLSAPVVAAGQTTKHLVLPPGNWLSWWDGTPYTGSASMAIETDVSAALDTLPLFVQEGAIIPMLRPTIRTLAPVAAGSGIESYANDPGILYVRVVPSATATSFTVFDGTQLTQQRQGSGVDLSFTQGSTFVKGGVFEVIATAKPTSVTRDGMAVTEAASADALATATDGWFWENSTGGTLWVRVPGEMAKVSAR